MENKESDQMNMSTIILIILYVLLSVAGLVIFKIGSTKGFAFAIQEGNLKVNLNLMVLLGLLMYIGSFLIYTVVISKFDLSYIFPLCTGFVYILVFISSRLFLKENINLIQCFGAGLILCGVILINIKK